MNIPFVWGNARNLEQGASQRRGSQEEAFKKLLATENANYSSIPYNQRENYGSRTQENSYREARKKGY